MLNPDFKEIISALSVAKAEFLLVGAYAMAAHGYPRATGDLDLWVRPSPENAACVWNALVAFGAPMSKIKLNDFVTPDIVYQIGLPPRRIDILTTISGVQFEEAWSNRKIFDIAGLLIPVISRTDLIQNKRAVGRTKDLADVENLLSDNSQ